MKEGRARSDVRDGQQGSEETGKNGNRVRAQKALQADQMQAISLVNKVGESLRFQLLLSTSLLLLARADFDKEKPECSTKWGVWSLCSV